MPFRKSSNPEVLSGPGRSFKYKRQLSEDGRQLRRGSLGGALTGEFGVWVLPPRGVADVVLMAPRSGLVARLSGGDVSPPGASVKSLLCVVPHNQWGELLLETLPLWDADSAAWKCSASWNIQGPWKFGRSAVEGLFEMCLHAFIHRICIRLVSSRSWSTQMVPLDLIH